MQIKVRWGVVLGAAMVFLVAQQVSLSQVAEDDSAAALEIVGQFNQWRMELGIAPLKPNPILRDLALDQALYLSTLSDIPSGTEMHLGRLGERPRERAVYPQFNWPTYGGQAAVVEVGAVGTAESAMTFWRGSDIHRETITNPIVREVGVAAVTHPWGHIYIAVLGSQPDVLPALVDPRTNLLYLTQDLWKFGPGNAPLAQLTLFDGEGRPLNNGAAIPWMATFPVPENTGGSVYVLYDDGISKSLMEVDLTADQVVLPFIPSP
jgi:uncharacterized protein YkwD